jgi:hypothetical protein
LGSAKQRSSGAKQTHECFLNQLLFFDIWGFEIDQSDQELSCDDIFETYLVRICHVCGPCPTTGPKQLWLEHLQGFVTADHGDAGNYQRGNAHEAPCDRGRTSPSGHENRMSSNQSTPDHSVDHLPENRRRGLEHKPAWLQLPL